MQAAVAYTPIRSTSRGGLHLDACRIAYIQHLREIAAGRAGVTIGLDLVSERARLAKEQADAQAMKNDITRGSVIEVAEAARQINRDYTAVRSRLLAIPSEHAPLTCPPRSSPPEM